MLNVFTKDKENSGTETNSMIISIQDESLRMFFRKYNLLLQRKKGKKEVPLPALLVVMLLENYLSYLPQLFSYQESCHGKTKSPKESIDVIWRDKI